MTLTRVLLQSHPICIKLRQKSGVFGEKGESGKEKVSIAGIALDCPFPLGSTSPFPLATLKPITVTIPLGSRRGFSTRTAPLIRASKFPRHTAWQSRRRLHPEKRGGVLPDDSLLDFACIFHQMQSEHFQGYLPRGRYSTCEVFVYLLFLVCISVYRAFKVSLNFLFRSCLPTVVEKKLPLIFGLTQPLEEYLVTASLAFFPRNWGQTSKPMPLFKKT